MRDQMQGTGAGNSAEKKSEVRNGAESKRRSAILPPLLIVLSLVFVLSSGVLGFALGSRATGNPLGEHLDTIPLIPPSSSDITENGDEVTHFLSAKIKSETGHLLKSEGDIFDEDGNLLPNVKIKLGSKEEQSSDSEGIFRISDIRTGAYTLKVIDGNRRVLAASEILFDFTESRVVEADLSVGAEMKITAPDNARMLELSINIEGNELSLEKDSSYITTNDYDIIGFNGKMAETKEDSVVLTEFGNLVLPDGQIITLADGEIITTEGYIERINTAVPIIPGIVMNDEDEIVMDSGETILPDMTIRDNEGNEIRPDENPVEISDEGAGDLGMEKDYVPEPKEPEKVPEASAEPEPEEAESVPEEIIEPPEETEGIVESEDDAAEGNGLKAGVQETPAPTPSPTPEPAPTPTPDPNFSVATEGGAPWTQQSMIDLFSNRLADAVAQGSGGRTRDMFPTEIIGPGDEGYYVFRLKNDNSFDIEFQLGVHEQTLHIPMVFSLFSHKDHIPLTYGEQMTDDGTMLTDKVVIPANTAMVYRLEWIWQYESTDRNLISKMDKIDTQLGGSDEKQYIISLDIYAERYDKIKVDDDTRYPGIRK